MEKYQGKFDQDGLIAQTRESAAVNVSINELVPDDWKDYEYLRHEMLRTDPSAFPPQAFDDLTETEEKWRLRIKDGIVVVAYDVGKPVGMVRATFDGNTSRIWNMYTEKAYRGMGLGKKLMGNIMGKIEARGSRVVELEVEDTQIAARTMYEHSFGFHETGRVVNERGGYMITMKKQLIPSAPLA
jgi:ribosomal protein S18 acetylase RimI-like enzyme